MCCKFELRNALLGNPFVHVKQNNLKKTSAKRRLKGLESGVTRSNSEDNSDLMKNKIMKLTNAIAYKIQWMMQWYDEYDEYDEMSGRLQPLHLRRYAGLKWPVSSIAGNQCSSSLLYCSLCVFVSLLAMTTPIDYALRWSQLLVAIIVVIVEWVCRGVITLIFRVIPVPWKNEWYAVHNVIIYLCLFVC